MYWGTVEGSCQVLPLPVCGSSHNRSYPVAVTEQALLALAQGFWAPTLLPCVDALFNRQPFQPPIIPPDVLQRGDPAPEGPQSRAHWVFPGKVVVPI